MPRLEQMFDPEVLAQLRETFDRADAGSTTAPAPAVRLPASTVSSATVASRRRKPRSCAGATVFCGRRGAFAPWLQWRRRPPKPRRYCAVGGVAFSEGVHPMTPTTRI